MKRLLPILVLFFSFFLLPGYSQEKKTANLPKNFRKIVDQFAQRLKLTDDQKQKMEGVLEQHQQECWDVYFQAKSGRITPQEAQKAQRQLTRKIVKQIIPFLSSDQRAKLGGGKNKKGKPGNLGKKGKKGKKGKLGKPGKKGGQPLNPQQIKKLLQFKNYQEEEKLVPLITRLAQLQQQNRQTLGEMRFTLQQAVRDPKAPREMIDKMVEVYEQLKEESVREEEGAKEELRGAITPRQKAVLIAVGIL